MKEPLLITTDHFFLFLASFIVTTSMILFLCKFSKKLGLIDTPGGRKKHARPVPLVGGIAIFITLTLLWLPHFIMNPVCWGFWIASTSLISICIIDDKYPLPAKVRIFAQCISIYLIIYFGKTALMHLGNLLGFGVISLGGLSVFFTLFALMGVVNAVNMMDGVDGLTGSISFVELCLLLFLSIRSGANTEASLIVVCLGAIISFLLFNFPSDFSIKNKIFLGDAGSMLLGLILAWICVRLTQAPYDYPPALMLWILALPLMDTIHLIFNRKIRGISPFQADRRHIHHILLQLGYSSKQIALILSLFSLLIGQIGIVLFINNTSNYALFYSALFLIFLYSTGAYLLKKRVAHRKYKFFATY